MPNAATLESLTIEINGNASSASSGITSLIAPLRSLARSVGTVVPALKSLNTELRALKASGVNLAKLMGVGEMGKQTHVINGWVNSLKDFKSKASVMPRFQNIVKKDPSYFRPDMYGPKPLFNPNNRQPYGSNDSLSRMVERYAQENGGVNPYKNFPGIVMPDGTIKYATGANGEQIASYFGGKMPNSSGSAFRSAVQSVNAPQPQIPPRPVANQSLVDGFWQKYGDQAKQGLPETAAEAQKATTAINGVGDAMKKSATASNGATQALKAVDRELKQKGVDGKTAQAGLKGTASGAAEAGQSAKKAHPHLEMFGKGLSRLGRIAKTMLIRTALRALMKAFGESWQAAYAFSNAMDGSFAKSVDQAKTLLADTTTSIIQAFAPAFEAMVPILYVVANAIQYLCQGIIYLMSLLGMTSDVAGASTQKVNKYYGASSKGAKGAAKDNKNLLASWDELNIIQSKNSSGGSSGGGSGYKPGSLKDLVSDEMSAVTAIIVGEALLAVGLILTCTGHFGIGIGLMAIGAASIAKTLIADWGKLPKQVKKSIAEIMTIAGTAMLALGVILACTGHLGIGIGLIALGIANIAGIVAASWDDELETGVKQTITKITAIAGGAMLALGIILACCGMLPMGIGLIVAGVGSLGVAVGLNWGSIVNTVNSVMTDISNWFVEKWEAIKTATSNAWDEVSKWWDDNIAKPVEEAWNSVSAFFAKLFAGSDTEGSIAYYAKIGWDAITYWWDTNIATPFTESWDLVKDYFKLLFSGDKTKEGSIAYFADKAWTSISTWWTNIKDTFSKAWDDVVTYFRDDVWGSTEQGGTIVGTVWDAWQTVETWWTGIYDLVSGAWDSVKTFFKELWIGADGNGGIAGWISVAWNSVVHFWKEDIWGSITAAWEGIGKFFSELFAPIKDAWEYLQKILGFQKNPANVNIGNMITQPNSPSSKITNSNKALQYLFGFAGGGYDIPSGDLFIANEAGAELVGTMNGKTTVANQTQIIEGIQAGVYAAQSDQNELLRRQNDLLTELINKSGDIRVTPSAEWGKFNQRSGEMWNRVSGR